MGVLSSSGGREGEGDGCIGRKGWASCDGERSVEVPPWRRERSGSRLEAVPRAPRTGGSVVHLRFEPHRSGADAPGGGVRARSGGRPEEACARARCFGKRAHREMCAHAAPVSDRRAAPAATLATACGRQPRDVAHTSDRGRVRAGERSRAIHPALRLLRRASTQRRFVPFRYRLGTCAGSSWVGVPVGQRGDHQSSWEPRAGHPPANRPYLSVAYPHRGECQDADCLASHEWQRSTRRCSEGGAPIGSARDRARGQVPRPAAS